MEDTLKDVSGFVSEQKLVLAAKNLQHLLKIQEEQITLENVMGHLEQTLIDAHANNPTDMCEMMATQAQILDALFHHYIDKSKDTSYTQDDKIQSALKFQQQAVRTATAWKRLKNETYIKSKIVRYFVGDEKTRGTD